MRSSLLAAALLAGAALQTVASDFDDWRAQAQRAQRARDYAQMRRALEGMLALRPDYPALLYSLAAVQTLLGDEAAALASLRRLARLGLTYDLDADEALAPLRDDAGYDALARRLLDNGAPLGEAEPVFSAGGPRFIPQGLAYDPASQSFFLGSVHERQILRIDPRGRATVFVPPGAEGLWSVLGLQVDATRRLLWAASSAFAEMQGYDPLAQGRAALFAFSLDDGRLVHRFRLPPDGRLHALSDLLVTDDGRVFTTDAAAGELLQLDIERGRFERLNADCPLVSPQGLARSADGSALIVADYAQGLFRLELARRRWTRLSASAQTVLYGIDGLYRWRDSLVAIQNGIRPHRILRLALDATGTHVASAEVLAAALPAFDEPALGVVVGDAFYFVANGQWGRLDAEHRLPADDAGLQPPRVMRLDLWPVEETPPSRSVSQPPRSGRGRPACGNAWKPFCQRPSGPLGPSKGGTRDTSASPRRSGRRSPGCRCC